MDFVFSTDEIYKSDSFITTEMTFNLIKAQKILANMKKTFPSLATNNLSSFTISSSTLDNTISVNENFTNIKSIANKRIDKFYTRFQFEHDMLTLKNLIFKKNSEIGMDKILSELDFLGALKREYSSLVEADTFKSKNITDFTEQHLQSLFDEIEKNKSSIKSHPGSESINLTILSNKNIEDMIKKISKQINHLENTRDSLNAITTVSALLSNSTIQLLGL